MIQRVSVLTMAPFPRSWKIFAFTASTSTPATHAKMSKSPNTALTSGEPIVPPISSRRPGRSSTPTPAMFIRTKAISSAYTLRLIAFFSNA